MSLPTLLVTGGAGFIGSNLITKLLPHYEVICVDDFNDYYFPYWKEENVEAFLNHPHFKLYKTDVRDYQGLEGIFKTYSINKIVHLAARAGVRPSIQQPLLYEEVNVRGTLNLLELAKTYQVSQFILASTSSIYGNQEKTPFSETDPVDHPVSPYAATKKSAELLAATYAHLYHIKTTCLRFFTVYGPKGRPDMAPYLFTKAIFDNQPITRFGDGQTMRDYTYVDDIVRGIEAALTHEFDYEIINLGNNNPVSLSTFIATLEALIGKNAKIVELPIQPGDVEKTFADISKAQHLLSWKPEVSLEIGLKKFVDWYRENRA